MLTTKLRGVSTAWRVLLVDGTSLKIVSSCVKMSDLAEANVSGACDETRDEMDRTMRHVLWIHVFVPEKCWGAGFSFSSLPRSFRPPQMVVHRPLYENSPAPLSSWALQT